MQTDIKEQTINITLKQEDYSVEVVYQCFYWYGADFDVDISKSGDELGITLVSKSAAIDHASVISKIKRDLVDFKLREIVSKETQTIRELLIAKAFAFDDTHERDPETVVTDPVGYDPLATKP